MIFGGEDYVGDLVYSKGIQVDLRMKILLDFIMVHHQSATMSFRESAIGASNLSQVDSVEYVCFKIRIRMNIM